MIQNGKKSTKTQTIQNFKSSDQLLPLVHQSPENFLLILNKFKIKDDDDEEHIDDHQMRNFFNLPFFNSTQDDRSSSLSNLELLLNVQCDLILE